MNEGGGLGANKNGWGNYTLRCLLTFIYIYIYCIHVYIWCFLNLLAYWLQLIQLSCTVPRQGLPPDSKVEQEIPRIKCLLFSIRLETSCWWDSQQSSKCFTQGGLPTDLGHACWPNICCNTTLSKPWCRAAQAFCWWNQRYAAAQTEMLHTGDTLGTKAKIAESTVGTTTIGSWPKE